MIAAPSSSAAAPAIAMTVIGAPVSAVSEPFVAPLPSVLVSFLESAGFVGWLGVTGSVASFSNTAWTETLPSGMVKALFSMVTSPLSTFHSLKW